MCVYVCVCVCVCVSVDQNGTTAAREEKDFGNCHRLSRTAATVPTELILSAARGGGEG